MISKIWSATTATVKFLTLGCIVSTTAFVGTLYVLKDKYSLKDLVTMSGIVEKYLPAEESGYTISVAAYILTELQETTLVQAMDHLYFIDTEVAVITPEYLANINELWKKLLIVNSQYQTQGFDCDNFAEEYNVFIKKIFHNHVGSDAYAEIAVWKLGHWFTDGYGHAANIVYTTEGFYVVEPQNGLMMPLQEYIEKFGVVAAFAY